MSGTNRTWDQYPIHAELGRLSAARASFRMHRMINRLRSPRRIVATCLAVAFFLLYALNGVFILSARAPADPERLRLWLSGGMVIYAVYHSLRCAWATNTSELELTSAEKLWLGGAPVQRSSLAVYHIGSMLLPAMLKTLLLAVVLFNDVQHFELLLIGVFSSLVLLETSRLIIARWTTGLGPVGKMRFRWGITLVATALALQVLTYLIASTPSGSPTWVYILNAFRSLGQSASSDMVQWLSLAWIPGAHLAVTEAYSPMTFLQLLAAVSVLPLSVLVLVRVDRWSEHRRLLREQQRLANKDFDISQSPTSTVQQLASVSLPWIDRLVPRSAVDAAAIASRQWISIKQYRGTILFSFAIPTLLCLSPLMTGQVKEQWFFVVGGIALCTMLLAPPALRIDFRRDLRRMLLLRGLPVKPLSMVIGQLAFPTLITCCFQWLIILVAVHVTQPGWFQAVLWTGLLNALAVFTFAIENALFLAYPHHERAEGVAMMIRTKLTFLGKTSVMLISLALLFAWSLVCRSLIPGSLGMTAFVGGAILIAWSIAAVALWTTAVCWRRFDFANDTPPE